MSNKSQRSNFLIYVAGASILTLGLGIALYYASKEDEPIVKEIKQLGKIKLIKVQSELGPVEVIDFDFFNKVMKIIKTNLLKLEAQSKDDYVKRRLSFYKE